MMSVDEAREKWEPAFWNAYYSSRQVGDHGYQMLVRVMNGIAADGYYVDVIRSAQDPSLTGLAFHEISSTAYEKKKLEEKRNERHKGTDCGAQRGREKNRRGGIAMMDYGSIFISVRQRIAAFRYFNEWLGGSSGYGHIKEDEYLDDAYRFLNTSASRDFIGFCAKKEAMTFDEYCDAMDINVDGLVAREPLTTIEDGQCITQKTR